MRPATAGPVLHKVEAGDTLGTLSRLYGVSPEKLREANQWQHVDDCESFWIPASPAHWVVHTVAEGESLALISQGYNIPLQQLRDANGLLSDPLKAGSTLYLPRAAKPSWNAPARKTLQASRGARPVAVVPIAKAPVAAPVSAPRVSPILSEKPSGKWVQVTSLDGRKGWIQQSELVFTPPQASHPSSTERARERSMTLAYGQKLNPDQKSAIRKISEHLASHQLYVEPDHIAVFMALETGGTFDPAIRPKNHPNHAVGLAQFTQVAINELNKKRSQDDKLDMDRLAEMNFEEQSEIVAEYLRMTLLAKKMAGKVVASEDLYSAIFCPVAVGEELDFVVYSKARDQGRYTRNSSLDTDKNGEITKKEMTSRLLNWLREGESLRG